MGCRWDLHSRKGSMRGVSPWQRAAFLSSALGDLGVLFFWNLLMVNWAEKSYGI